MLQLARVSTTLLRNVPLFAGLDEEQLNLLVSTIVRKSVGRNAKIIGAAPIDMRTNADLARDYYSAELNRENYVRRIKEFAGV